MLRRLQHMSISFEGVVYLLVMAVVLSAAVVRQINLLMILYGVMAGPLLLSWRLVRRTVKGLEVTRRLPPTVFAGQHFSIELEVTNKKPKSGSFAVWIRDELQRRVPGGEKSIASEVYIPHIPGGESRKSSYQGVLDRRGLYRFQPLKLSSRFPLGLLRTMIRLDQPQKLLVLPAIGRLSPVWHRLLATDGEAAGGKHNGRNSGEGDFYGLREWRAGDAQARIHWRTSARRQTLTVRQFERRRRSELDLLVELREPRYPTPDDRERTEEVIRFAATVLHEFCRESGRALRLEVIGKTSRVIRTTSSQQTLLEALRVLAAAEATTDDRLAAAIDDAVGRGTHAVIASTHKCDLADRERFEKVWRRKESKAAIGRLTTLAPAEPGWRELFDSGVA